MSFGQGVLIVDCTCLLDEFLEKEGSESRVAGTNQIFKYGKPILIGPALFASFFHEPRGTLPVSS